MNRVEQLRASCLICAEIWANLLDRLVDISTLVESGDNFPGYRISQRQTGRTLREVAQLADPCFHIGSNRSVLVKVHAQGLTVLAAPTYHQHGLASV